MLSRSTLLHLRVPFSLFLLPVFLFALGQVEHASLTKVLLVFSILHFLLYPASNGYNSYFDRDKSSIGGLRTPPPVSRQLYRTSLALDAIALLIGLLVGWQFVIMLLLYGLVSKAYSHPSIRIKRYPWTSWLVAGFFQGCFTFFMVAVGIAPSNLVGLISPRLFFAGFLCSLVLWGSYPMTQIYQHQEDRNRGDITLSQLLGITGTFHFTAVMFLLASMGFILYFKTFFNMHQAAIFLIGMLPVVIYFGYWYTKVRENPDKADFDHTMKLNLISSMCLNACFLAIYFLNS